MSNSKGKTALITGASAGIGKELARIHASKGDNLVLLARRSEVLESLKEELESAFDTSVYIIATDLSEQGTPSRIYNEIQKEGIQVDYLINNAGFSKVGYYHEMEWPAIQSMIMLHVMNLAELCRLFLPDMLERNEGKILNVASSAAFAPGGPLQTTYFATKAFIVSFSQGLAGELCDTNITVTALCPGATETEFEKVSGLDKTPLFTKEKVFSARSVAEDGYNAMMEGKLVKLTALTGMNKFLLKNMNLFPARKIMENIKARQEVNE